MSCNQSFLELIGSIILCFKKLFYQKITKMIKIQNWKLYFQNLEIFEEKNWEIILNESLDWDEEFEDFMDDIFENSVDNYTLKNKVEHKNYIPADWWEIVLATWKNYKNLNFNVNLGFYSDHHKISDQMREFVETLIQESLKQIGSYSLTRKNEIILITKNDLLNH